MRATYLTFFGEPRGAAAYTDDHDPHDLHDAAAAGAALEAHDAPAVQVQQEGELEERPPTARPAPSRSALEEHDDGHGGGHGAHDDHAATASTTRRTSRGS